jgi:hypothetical protein
MSDNLSSVLHRFRTASANFIKVVDSAPNLERDEFIASLNRSLAELYSSALHLPAVEPDTAGENGTPFAAEKWAELCRSLTHSLKEKIGSLDVYWAVFDSTEKSEPAQGSLAGDVSEIYADLKESLELETKGISFGDFVWDLRESFREHWGRHATEALKAIYNLHL